MALEPKHDFLAFMVEAHGPRLRRFLSARLRNAAVDTPDLMQEVYLRLLRLKDHDAIRNPQAYLFTIANHVLYQHTLRQSSTLESVGLMDLAPRLQSELETDPAVQVEMDQAFEQIERSLIELSPRVYATLVLSRCEGMRLEEIGEQLGVSRAMAAKYLAKALTHVRQHLTRIG